MKGWPSHLPAWGASGIIVAAAAFSVSPLTDAATGLPAPDVSLTFPFFHLLLTPFSVLADFLSFNSGRQHLFWALYLIAGYWLWRWLGPQPKKRLFYVRGAALADAQAAIAGFLLYLGAILLFCAWGALWPRAAARIAPHADMLSLDFHSHTSRSWDARKSFTPRANLRWHEKTGFHAAFITDHHTQAGAVEAKKLSAEEFAARPSAARALQGQEIGALGLHIVYLGPSPERPRGGAHQDTLKSLLSGRTALLSLPEFDANYPPHEWPKLIEAGAAGFEIANGSPKALAFTRERREALVELCRKANKAVVGATDAHGWGRTAYAWNLMRLPGHERLSPAQLEDAVIAKIRRDGFGAVRVLHRTRVEPSRGLSAALDPLRALWLMLLTLTPAQRLALLLWVWALAGLRHFLGLRT